MLSSRAQPIYYIILFYDIHYNNKNNIVIKVWMSVTICLDLIRADSNDVYYSSCSCFLYEMAV